MLAMLPGARIFGQCTPHAAGLNGLAVISVTDSSVNFHWTGVGAGSGQNYEYAITNDSLYTRHTDDSSHVYYIHYTADTVATQDSLQPATKYWIFIQNAQCSHTDSVSFVTAAAAKCKPGSTPVPSIRSSTGSWVVCGNGQMVLTSANSTGNTWFLNGRAVDSGSSTYVVTQSGNYSLAVLYPNGCRDTSAVQPVVLDPGPPTPVLTTSGSPIICNGSSVMLYSSSGSGNQWYEGNSLLPGMTGTEFSADSAGVYWVQVKDSVGCFANSAQVTVSINPASSGQTVKPTISPAGPVELCGDTAVVLVASHADNFQWFWDGDAIPGQNSDTMVVTLMGSYTVATGTAGCGSVGALSAPVEVTFIDQLQPVISLVNGVLVSSYATGNHWYLNGGVIRGATNQHYTPRVPGSYTVRVGFGVQTVDTTTFQIGVGGCYSAFSTPWMIEDSNLVAPQVVEYPNPVTDVMTLWNKAAGPVTVRVFDLMGQEIFMGRGMVGTFTVGVSGWSKGVYFLQIIDERTQLQQKVVVVKL